MLASKCCLPLAFGRANSINVSVVKRTIALQRLPDTGEHGQPNGVVMLR